MARMIGSRFRNAGSVMAISVTVLLLFSGSSGEPSGKQQIKPLVLSKDYLSNCCDEVSSVSISLDGSILAGKTYSADFMGDRSILLWDLRTGALVGSMHGSSGVDKIYLAPNGTSVLSASGFGSSLDGRNDYQLGASGTRVISCSVSPNGRLIAAVRPHLPVTSPVEIELLDAETRKLVQVLESPIITGRNLQFSPDGQTLIAGSLNTIQFWDIASGRLLRSIRTDRQNCALFVYSSPLRRIAVTGCDSEPTDWISVLDAETGAKIGSLDGHKSRIWSLALSPDGRILASMGSDSKLKLWDLERYELVKTIVVDSRIIRSATFSPDGRIIAAGIADNEIQILSVRSGMRIVTFRAYKDGTWVSYTEDGYYNSSDGETPKLQCNVNGVLHDGMECRSLFFRPDIVAQRLAGD